MAAFAAVLAVAAWGMFSPSQASQQAPQAGPPIAFPSATPGPNVAPHPSVGPPNWHLVYNPKFTGTHLDTSKWNTCYPWVPQPAAGCTNFGNVKEVEWYLPGQDRVSNKVLSLVAQRKKTVGVGRDGHRKYYPCRSGMVTSDKSFTFKYGYVRIVARVTEQPGLWSALWLGAANFKWPPEIDLIEAYGLPNIKAGVNLHPGGGKAAHVSLSPEETKAITKGWHTFSLLWTYHKLVWYVDKRSVMVVHRNIPHLPMYLIFNVADNAKPAGFCNGRMLIKSVQVWKR
jgi:beta-glucanase (GH16 family)